MAENYLTTREVAEILNVSKVTVTRMVKRGHFPGTRKIDPTLRYSPLRIPESAVIEYQKKQIVTPSEE